MAKSDKSAQIFFFLGSDSTTKFQHTLAQLIIVDDNVFVFFTDFGHMGGSGWFRCRVY